MPQKITSDIHYLIVVHFFLALLLIDAINYIFGHNCGYIMDIEYVNVVRDSRIP